MLCDLLTIDEPGQNGGRFGGSGDAGEIDEVARTVVAVVRYSDYL